jgi:hypothetical protein
LKADDGEGEGGEGTKRSEGSKHPKKAEDIIKRGKDRKRRESQKIETRGDEGNQKDEGG